MLFDVSCGGSLDYVDLEPLEMPLVPHDLDTTVNIITSAASNVTFFGTYFYSSLFHFLLPFLTLNQLLIA